MKRILVIDNRINDKYTLYDLTLGDTFEYNGSLYMLCDSEARTSAVNITEDEYMVVELATGKLEVLLGGTQINKIKVKAEIVDSKRRLD